MTSDKVFQTSDALGHSLHPAGRKNLYVYEPVPKWEGDVTMHQTACCEIRKTTLVPYGTLRHGWRASCDDGSESTQSGQERSLHALSGALSPRTGDKQISRLGHKASFQEHYYVQHSSRFELKPRWKILVRSTGARVISEYPSILHDMATLFGPPYQFLSPRRPT